MKLHKWTPIYDFLIMFNSNIWPNCSITRYLDDHEFDLPFKLLKVKCYGAIGLHIWSPVDIYIVARCLSHRLAVTASHSKCFLLSLIIRPWPQITRIANAQSDRKNYLRHYKVKGTPYLFYQCTQVPILTPFVSATTRFEKKNQVSCLSIGYNDEFDAFEKITAQNLNSKF